jgi:hypothetical protein
MRNSPQGLRKFAFPQLEETEQTFQFAYRPGWGFTGGDNLIHGPAQRFHLPATAPCQPNHSRKQSNRISERIAQLIRQRMLSLHSQSATLTDTERPY